MVASSEKWDWQIDLGDILGARAALECRALPMLLQEETFVPECTYTDDVLVLIKCNTAITQSSHASRKQR